MAVGTALPEHRYPQAQVTQMLTGVLGVTDRQRALVERVHRNAGVGHRHLVRPLEDYADLGDFGARNDIFLAEGVELGSQALLQALADAGLDPEDVDLIVSTTVTGIAVPSIESRVAARIGLRDDVKRVPLMGLGCVAGAAGIARVHDYLVGHPDEVAVL
ncbi:MAG: type III polyketide synthase, partial [Lapillicoccus sp.]